ncbi:MAG: family 43 glycosylhydrolase [Clostridiales bacterium]|nr:family 43 glycosylhydrolase [Clostridiales bacterium]
MKKQVYNPYLPLNEYIPDGEPHVFGDRVYIYGSHDKEGGYTFCMQDYVVYSAPVSDLSDWRFEGVSYRADQDPDYPNPRYMYAPDVVQGNDGRFYLFYCMGGDYGYDGYSGTIKVAVSDRPQGPFDFLGQVRYKDGTPMRRYVCFDPAVMNDDGVIRVYYGTQYCDEEEYGLTDEVIAKECGMFGRTPDEIRSYPDSINGAIMLTLEDDMLTVKKEPRHIIPYKVKGTGFEAHPFFEGSSIRKFNGIYYFIYSSWQNHELCYATSRYPDRDFQFQGTIVSNGDVGYKGRTTENKLNMTGTTHGSILNIGDDYYIFFHRLTHKSDYSRQSCAEKIYMKPDGNFDQVEITSCGLNGGPLEGAGTYPAVICCNLTNGMMPHGSNTVYSASFPNITNKGNDRFIGEIDEGTLIGYKYLDLRSVSEIGITARVETEDNRVIFTDPIRIDERAEADNEKLKNRKVECSDTPYVDICLAENGDPVGRLDIGDSAEWTRYQTAVSIKDGIYPLFFRYHGPVKIQIRDIFLNSLEDLS